MKTAEQIAADKAAIADMKKAAASMQAAIRRVESLELTVKAVNEKLEHLSSGFGTTTAILWWTKDGQKYAPIKDCIAELRNDLARALP